MEQKGLNKVCLALDQNHLTIQGWKIFIINDREHMLCDPLPCFDALLILT